MKLLKTMRKNFRTSLIKISSKLPSSVQLRLYRSLTNIPETLPPGFEFKIANTKQEFIEAAKIVHDEYLRLNIIEPQHSGLRLNPYLTIPTTAVLIVKHYNRVVGTVSLIRDNPIGLPMDKIFDLSTLRSTGERLCEVSGLAIADNYKGNKLISCHLIRFLLHYAANNRGIDRLVISVHPKSKLFYKSLLNFSVIKQSVVAEPEYMKGAPALPMTVLIKDMLMSRIGSPVARGQNNSYFIKNTPYYFHENTSQCAEVFNEIFFENKDLFSKIETQKLINLHRTYCKTPLINILPELKNEEIVNFRNFKGRRFWVDCDTQLYVGEKIISAITYNVSNRGCLIKATSGLKIGETFLVKINIGESKNILAFAKTIWSHQNGLTGLSLQSFSKSEDWDEYIRYLRDNVLSRSIRSTSTYGRGLA